MKKNKQHQKNNKKQVDVKESKKIITFGIIFGAILIGLGIVGIYFLTN